MANHTTLDFIKMAISMALVVFSITIVTALMFGENTRIAADFHPAVALVLMWALILWLSLVEGGKCAVVGLVPVDGDLYKDSHPITNKICALAHKGDNLDRYLMGRQFMVIFISFVINLCGAPLAGAEVFNLPSWVESIFLGTGVAMVLTVVVVGQLTTQINATTCMLDYINTHFMTFTLWVALIIEKTGVMHMCYLVKYLVYWLAGKPVVTNEAPRTTVQSVFFYGRCLWSIGILSFALAATIDALFKGQTTMWAGVPEGVSVVVFFVLMVFAGLLEGMQIALFAVAKLPKSEQGSNPIAMKTCELMFHGDEKAFARFNVGRQMFVTLCFFVIARVTTLDITIGVDENIFGVSDGVQKFFNMGFLGAIIATILGSISWQLVASAFPREFLSNPLIYVFALICLALEATGICSGAWFLAIFHRKLNRLQNDDVYIGTAEERAVKGKADSTSESEEEAAEPVEAEGEAAVAGSTDNV